MGSVGCAQDAFDRVHHRINGKGFRQRGRKLKRRVPGQFVRGQSSGGHDDRHGHAGGTQHLDQFNPGQAGKSILGQKVYAKLSDIPEPVDMVDIFRTSEHALPIVKEALTLRPPPQVIWMQLTVRTDEAAKLAENAGLKVVMNRCPKIEYGRLSSEISWMGVNSRTLSSRRAQTLGSGVQRMRLSPPSEKDKNG